MQYHNDDTGQERGPELLSRREFLASTALAGAALSVGSASWAAQAAAQSGEPEKGKNQMKTRKLGSLEVSELGFGNMGLSGGHYGPGVDREQGIRVIRDAHLTWGNTHETSTKPVCREIVSWDWRAPGS